MPYSVADECCTNDPDAGKRVKLVIGDVFDQSPTTKRASAALALFSVTESLKTDLKFDDV